MPKHGGLVGPTWVVFSEIGGMWVWVLKCGFLEPTWVWWVFDVGFSNPRGFGGFFVGLVGFFVGLVDFWPTTRFLGHRVKILSREHVVRGLENSGNWTLIAFRARRGHVSSSMILMSRAHVVHGLENSGN